ncbi:MAG: hypothetical protein LBL90_08245 [Prevotellaceae bacterium]|nr:hypothetical protein [Prevotellaceae bacterium]
MAKKGSNFCGFATKGKGNNKYHRDDLAQVVVEPYSIMYYDGMRGFSIEYNVLNLSAKYARVATVLNISIRQRAGSWRKRRMEPL